jgi:hypothetical protein
VFHGGLARRGFPLFCFAHVVKQADECKRWRRCRHCRPRLPQAGTKLLQCSMGPFVVSHIQGKYADIPSSAEGHRTSGCLSPSCPSISREPEEDNASTLLLLKAIFSRGGLHGAQRPRTRVHTCRGEYESKGTDQVTLAAHPRSFMPCSVRIARRPHPSRVNNSISKRSASSRGPVHRRPVRSRLSCSECYWLKGPTTAVCNGRRDQPRVGRSLVFRVAPLFPGLRRPRVLCRGFALGGGCGQSSSYRGLHPDPPRSSLHFQTAVAVKGVEWAMPVALSLRRFAEAFCC